VRPARLAGIVIHNACAPTPPSPTLDRKQAAVASALAWLDDALPAAYTAYDVFVFPAFQVHGALGGDADLSPMMLWTPPPFAMRRSDDRDAAVLALWALVAEGRRERAHLRRERRVLAPEVAHDAEGLVRRLAVRPALHGLLQVRRHRAQGDVVVRGAHRHRDDRLFHERVVDEDVGGRHQTRDGQATRVDDEGSQRAGHLVNLAS